MEAGDLKLESRALRPPGRTYGKGGGPPPFFWKCMILSGFKSFVLKVCETKGFTDVFLRKCVKLRELGEKIGSRQLRVESDRPQTGDKRMPGGGSVFDRAVIVIFQGLFYHTGMLKSRNFCKSLGMSRLKPSKPEATGQPTYMVFACRLIRLTWLVRLCSNCSRASFHLFGLEVAVRLNQE